jgi:osmoprotectant transport system substrate-binding protein
VPAGHARPDPGRGTQKAVTLIVITRRRLQLTALLCGAALALSACAGNKAFNGGSGSSPTGSGGASGQTIVVGGANFTEMLIMQAMYVELLQHAGFTTDTVTADNREIYFPELSKGNIDVVPEYAATLAEFLNLGANGKDAKPIATNDAQATVQAMRPLAEKQNVKILEPAKAADQNGFAVTKQFADANHITTLSELGALKKPVTLAATEECPTRPFCEPGLKNTYGIDVSSVLPTGFGTPQTKQAVQSDQAQLGLVATTDGTLGQFDLVLLKDDKHLQLADNLVPAVNADVASDRLVKALDSLSSVLTTDDLVELNRKVDAERLQAKDVAHDYLTSKGLLG